MSTVFCTYFDSRYLTRGLVMAQSLRRHHPTAELYVLCMDDSCHAAISDLRQPGMTAIRLSDLESADPQLHAAKATRSTIEYYFTTTPALPLYILRRRPDVAFVAYVDADLFFYADSSPLWDELGNASVGILRHRFPPAIAHLERWGIFNVGYLIFRNDETAIRVLEWWRERCIEWCYDRLEGERFADQKYLEQWPRRFTGVTVLEHRGANVAPWNVGGSTFTARGGDVFVDGEQLLFYHFHRLRQWSRSVWQLGLAEYRARPSAIITDRLYKPYIAALNACSERLRVTSVSIPHGYLRASSRLRLPQLVRAPYYLLRGELIVQSPTAFEPDMVR